MYKPSGNFPIKAILLVPTVEKINGVNVKSFTEGLYFFCSAKSYGGTEKVVNDVISVEDTNIIECWYSPRFKSGCRIRLLDDDSEWEIITPPENIERRNKYMKFKVRRINGGA